MDQEGPAGLPFSAPTPTSRHLSASPRTILICLTLLAGASPVPAVGQACRFVFYKALQKSFVMEAATSSQVAPALPCKT